MLFHTPLADGDGIWGADACDEQETFDSHQTAQEQVAGDKRYRGRATQVYLCADCQRWHIAEQ